MKKLSGNAYTLIVIIVLMLTAIVLSLRLQSFASKLLPVLFSSTVLFLAVIALVKEIKGRHGPKVTQSTREPGSREKNLAQAGSILRVAGWVVGFAMAIFVVGFMFATPLFVGAYMKRHGSLWLGAVITALLFTGIVYIVFDVALQAGLYRGQLLMWLGF